MLSGIILVFLWFWFVYSLCTLDTTVIGCSSVPQEKLLSVQKRCQKNVHSNLHEYPTIHVLFSLLGEVLLKISKVGICGSDVTLWKKGSIGPHVVKDPIITGHEASGHVMAIGKGVNHLKPGDRVALEASIPCLRCPDCREGAYHLCGNAFFHLVHLTMKLWRDISSGQPIFVTSEHSNFHSTLCDPLISLRLPENISDEEGALMEPLSVALHAFDRGEIKGGQIILICGAGPIGLMNLLLARAYGIVKVCITGKDIYIV